MKSKTKRRGLLGFIAGLPWIVQAFVWVVVTLGVVVFGGWAIWKIWQMAKLVNQPKVPPPYPQTNNVLRIYSTGTNDNQSNSKCIYDNSSAGPAPNQTLKDDQTGATNTQQGYTFQYGMWGLGAVPSMANGSNASPVTVVSSNSCVLAEAGYLIEMTASPDGTITAIQVTNDSTLYTLVIDETHNLKDWTPVFTNDSCLRWDIQNFTYTNDWTPIHFYRVRSMP